MSATSSTMEKTGAARAWLATVDSLLSQIEQWAAEEDWQVARLKAKRLSEGELGTYRVSDLRIRTHSGILNVVVVTGRTVGGHGRVDLVAFPTLDRFVLIWKGEHWVVKADSGQTWPKRWSRKTFVDIAERLTRTS